MIDNAVRARLPRYVGPLVALYGRLGLTPNQVTFIGFLIAIPETRRATDASPRRPR